MTQPLAINERPLPAVLPMTPALTVVLSLAIAALFVLSNLGGDSLANYDEAWHAIVALDIARSGDFLTYTEDGEITTASVKPPLYFWAMALSFQAIGPSEFAARLFPALCFVTMIGAVAWFLQRNVHWTVALTAAILLSTQQRLVYHHGARSGEIDPPLILLLTLTMLWCYRVYRGGRAWPMAVFWCAALLTKGVAAVQILPVVALWFMVERRWRELGRVCLWLAIGTVPAVAFFLVREHFQPGTLIPMIRDNFVSRLTHEIDDPEPQPVYFYAVRLWRSVLPVAIGLAITIIAVRFRLRLSGQMQNGGCAGPLVRMLLIWWLVPMLLFSFAGTKRVWYVYPSLIPLYILAAWALRAGLHRLESLGRNRLAQLITIGVLGGQVVPALIASLSVHRSDFERKLEEGRMVAAATAEGPAAADLLVLGYKLPVSDRFVLKRAHIPYLVFNEPSEFLSAVQATGDRCIVAFPDVNEAELDGLRGARVRLQQGRFPFRRLMLEHWQARETGQR